jgi:hypothetical protein
MRWQRIAADARVTKARRLFMTFNAAYQDLAVHVAKASRKP